MSNSISLNRNQLRFKQAPHTVDTVQEFGSIVFDRIETKTDKERTKKQINRDNYIADEFLSNKNMTIYFGNEYIYKKLRYMLNDRNDIKDNQYELAGQYILLNLLIYCKQLKNINEFIIINPNIKFAT